MTNPPESVNGRVNGVNGAGPVNDAGTGAGAVVGAASVRRGDRH